MIICEFLTRSFVNIESEISTSGVIRESKHLRNSTNFNNEISR